MDLTPLRTASERLVAEGSLAGLIVLYQKDGGGAQMLCTGMDRDGKTLEPETLFPVASITKLATALAALRLVDQGELTLDDPLSQHLPEAAAAVEGVTLRSLLCHISGLPEDIPAGAAPYKNGLDWPILRNACLHTALETAPWVRVNYSNTGSGSIAILVERITDLPFPSALKDLVLTPLGIPGYLGEEPPHRPAVIAGDMGKHQGTPLEPFNSPFWRALAMPWAGLITSADGANRLARAFNGEPAGFLSPGLLREATTDQTRQVPGQLLGMWKWKHTPWGLGVELRGVKTPHPVSRLASPQSFGHVGASGCQAWYDPAMRLSWVICGPRLFYLWWEEMNRLSETILQVFQE